ncbi:MAG TPA: hypothetical protein VF230_10190 [Acidimicrobiales bacterium]
MAEANRVPSPTPGLPAKPPQLHLVADPERERSIDDALADDAYVGRGAVIGALLGFGAVIGVVGVAGSLSGMEPGAALGLGGFVGFFGGGGFGFMTGAAAAAARIEASHRSRRPEERR